ncbi:tyrosine-type recombinase/integrase [Morganella morganii]|uniref:tyrosine-type recombinase/integrase n=1 Tax=Morganella morganii TaxID=582 RepID=UPI003BF867F0
MGEWTGDNPLDGVRQFKESDQELAFLYADDIKRLLTACDESSNKDLGIVVRICLATGARWGEAQGLTQSHVMPCKVTYTQTKSKKNRTVPISRTLFDKLPKRRGALFSNCYDAFERALKKSQYLITGRTENSRPEAYICQSLYDEWRKYISFATDIGS